MNTGAEDLSQFDISDQVFLIFTHPFAFHELAIQFNLIGNW